MDAASEKPRKDNTPRPKKPYEKPAFQYEKVFETAALACGKNWNSPSSVHDKPEEFLELNPMPRREAREFREHRPTSPIDGLAARPFADCCVIPRSMRFS